MRDHKRMVDTTLEDRLEQVRLACQFPTQAAFMEALSEERSQWRNWAKRGSIGRADVKMRELTGVDTYWLKTGKGEPFPNGPIVWSGAEPPELVDRVATMESIAGQVGAVLQQLIRAVSEKTPGVGEMLVAALSAELEARPDSSGQVLRMAIRAAREATPAAAAKAPSDPPRSTSRKRPGRV